MTLFKFDIIVIIVALLLLSTLYFLPDITAIPKPKPTPRQEQKEEKREPMYDFEGGPYPSYIP